jgi:hypothetical protein
MLRVDLCKQGRQTFLGDRSRLGWTVGRKRTWEDDVDVERVPDSWIGRRVETVVVRPVYPDQTRYSASLTALPFEGLLEKVNDRGIVASFSSEPEVLAAGTFYP